MTHTLQDTLQTGKVLQTGKTRWSHYQTAYHFVWIPKYRRKVLDGAVQKAAKVALQQCCQQHGFVLLALETDHDHVHCLVSAPPRWAPATIAGLLKGHSSRMLRKQFAHLHKACGRESLWTSAYYVGAAGAVSSTTIKRYISECQGK